MMRWLILRLALGLAALALAVGIAPNGARAAESYHLGEGDVVKLTVFQRPDLSIESRLGANGRIYVPGGGKLDVGGMSVPDAEKRITQLLTKAGAAPHPQVDLQVSTFGSQKVSVFGYVKAPGSYVLDRPTRVSDIVAQAGGILPDGSDHIVLLRTGADEAVSRSVINLKDIIDRGNMSADVEVKGGDIVSVPRAPRVYVYGSVNRPGPYILEDGMTPLQMISMAGGLSSTGSDNRLEVVRHGEGGNAQSMKVGLQDRLQPEDVLIVHESIF